MSQPAAIAPAQSLDAGALRPSLTEERRLWRAGHQWVAGMDEVGRGAWAGPVSVGVAVVRPDISARSVPRWLRDSKQLAEPVRESVFEELAGWCAAWAVGHAEHWECDALGMTAAVSLAGRRALDGLGVPIEALVVDGPRALVVPDAVDSTSMPAPPVPALPPVPVVPVVGGDARCVSVAAASVLAKVTRDRRMRAESLHFPPYDLHRNKGYPSPVHRMALAGYGLTAIHRRSWAYVDGLPWTGLGHGASGAMRPPA